MDDNTLAQNTADRPLTGADERQDLGREKISAFVITFNEKKHIRECLESLTFCDELVIIDSFSTDETPEIAKEFGAEVIQRPWPGYRAQKAFGLESVRNEWVINVDADERVSPELREEILGLLRAAHRKEPVFDAYEVNRVVFYLGRWWRKGGWYPEWRVRIFRRSKVTWGGIDPHEKPIVDGTVGQFQGELLHYTYEDIADQVRRLQSHSTAAALEDFRRGKKTTLRNLLLNPLLRVFKFYLLKKGFREGMAGIIVAILEGYYTFMKYAKLWELTRAAAEQKTEVARES